MNLNELSPAPGAKKKKQRVGRGPGSGVGKTAGRGVKGQRSRRGSNRSGLFQGGQMPLERRLPKFGFKSRKSLVREEVRLSEIEKMEGNIVDLQTLKDAGVIRKQTLFVKIMLSGSITKAVTVRGVGVTKGAKAAIESAGGSVETADTAA